MVARIETASTATSTGALRMQLGDAHGVQEISNPDRELHFALEVMSTVITKPFVPLNSKGLPPTRYASISLGITMKPSLPVAPSYGRFLTTTGSDVIPCALLSTISAVFPPSNRASARSFVCFHSNTESLSTANDFHFPGKSTGTMTAIASRCSFVADGSNLSTSQSYWSLDEVKFGPKSPAIQNLVPSNWVLPKLPRLILTARFKRQ